MCVRGFLADRGVLSEVPAWLESPYRIRLRERTLRGGAILLPLSGKGEDGAEALQAVGALG
jgi:hypothetical protein